jgi:hypothetical protein
MPQAAVRADPETARRIRDDDFDIYTGQPIPG